MNAKGLNYILSIVRLLKTVSYVNLS